MGSKSDGLTLNKTELFAHTYDEPLKKNYSHIRYLLYILAPMNSFLPNTGTLVRYYSTAKMSPY